MLRVLKALGFYSEMLPINSPQNPKQSPAKPSQQISNTATHFIDDPLAPKVSPAACIRN